MSNKLKQSLLLIALFLATAAFILYSYLKSITYYNEDDTYGSTAGNLYNGGLFCEQDGDVYFSNFDDDGALYKMDLNCDNIEKISDDKPSYINADDHYLYYARINYTKESSSQSVFTFFNRGIFRINHDGSNLLLLFKDPSGLLSLYGNQVYYQHYGLKTGTTFHQIDIDSKNDKIISNDPLIPASFYNGSLYYTGVVDEHNIHIMNANTKASQDLYNGNCYMPIATEDGIYYLSLEDNYAMCRIDLDGSNKTLLVDEFCLTFNLSSDGKTIYYQVDGGDHNRLCKIDLATMTSETIIEGNYNNIHVTSNYVFFRDFNKTTTYAYQPKNEELSIFRAPVLD